MIKVLIVDDSPTAREMIATLISTDPEIQILDKVSTGQEAIRFLETNPVKPDIITTDINMPGMSGFDMIAHIMAYFPLPILIITVLNRDANFMNALNLGALDIIEKPAPTAWDQLPKIGIELIEKVKLLARVKVITHIAGKKQEIFKASLTPGGLPSKTEKVICMASSTGGPNTLLKLLKMLPKKFPAPIFIVQHMSEGFFISGLVEWFRSSISMRVEEAAHGKKIEPGVIYIAPIKKHLLLEKDCMLLADDPADDPHKPSADLLFKSAASLFKSNAIGVVLTGAGDDGSKGACAIHKEGGTVLAEDKDSCVIFAMPEAAIKTGCVQKVLDLEGLAKEMMRLL